MMTGYFRGGVYNKGCSPGPKIIPMKTRPRSFYRRAVISWLLIGRKARTAHYFIRPTILFGPHGFALFLWRALRRRVQIRVGLRVKIKKTGATKRPSGRYGGCLVVARANSRSIKPMPPIIALLFALKTVVSGFKFYSFYSFCSCPLFYYSKYI